MHTAHLASIDLNLLVALQALLTERHVTRAARCVGLSQPAMSRALGRLRQTLDDPLLVRGPQGLEPTPRALALSADLDRLLDEVARLVRPPEFDPAQAEGTVQIAAPGMLAAELLPPFLALLAERAPALDVRVQPWRPSLAELMARQQVDLALGVPAGDEAGLRSRLILEHDWICLLKEDHPALKVEWTVERFATLDHVMVDFDGGPGQVDEALARLGLTRRVAVRVPYALLTPMLASDRPLVLTTARWMGLRLGPALGLEMRPCPVPLDPIRLWMVWHERTDRDPRSRWIRHTLQEAANSLSPAVLRNPTDASDDVG